MRFVETVPPHDTGGAVLDPWAGLFEGGGGGEDGLFVVFAAHDLEADGEAVG